MRPDMAHPVLIIAAFLLLACAPGTTHRESNRVPIVPPDTIPGWIYAESNLETNSSYMSGTFVRNIVVILFTPGATQAQRQEAIDLIAGQVVGGNRTMPTGGEYFIRIEDDGTAAALFRAIERLEALPQVEYAVPEQVVDAGDLFRDPVP